jgi:hypothetical protein
MGTPLTVEKRGRGTIESPCSPITTACTELVETPKALEMKYLKRIVSSIPLCPKTLEGSNSVTFQAR